MLNFRKTIDLKQMFENMVDRDCVVASIFIDNPDLEHFEFNCRSEYDDSNYSDFTELTKVNGHNVDYDGRYEDDEHYSGVEGDEPSDLPRMSVDVIGAIMDAVSIIGNYYGHDDHLIKRSNYIHRIKTISNLKSDEKKYLRSYITKEKIEESWFLKNHPKWAAYYAQDNGKFSKDAEVTLFCAKNRMIYAFMYAQALKKPLPKHIENYYTTKNLVDPHKEDDNWFKEYLKWKQNLEKTKVK